MNQQQQFAIDYLREENRVLKEQLGRRPLRLNDDQRRRLAARAKLLVRRVLVEVATIVTPKTLLAWHRKLIAQEYDGTAQRGPGRPRTDSAIEALVVRMAEENRDWGYRRILGALSNLGHQLGRGTIANILKENGIEPAPERGKHTRWSTFLKAHWECMTATDFLTIEVVTLKGLVTYYILFFIDIASRSVHIAGITPHPGSEWMMQIARNITDEDDGFLRGKRHLILDRDAKYCDEFRRALGREGLGVIRLPPKSPNLNAFAERFVRSLKAECLSRMIFFGASSLRHAISEYVKHYHSERNHQGIGNRLLQPAAECAWGPLVKRRARLGGMLSYYYRQAA